MIGVNSAIYTRTGSSMGIGFAIPINLVKEEIPELRFAGKISRGWLGVYIQKVTPALAESLGLDEPRGALVADVLKDGPALAAGIKRGDVIVAYNNRPIKDSQELPLMVGETPVGHKVTLKVSATAACGKLSSRSLPRMRRKSKRRWPTRNTSRSRAKRDSA